MIGVDNFWTTGLGGLEIGPSFQRLEGIFPALKVAIRKSKKSFNLNHLTGWCGQEDSNFHGLSATTTSTLRVYQFRHGRTPGK
jgi:hypothetical protein